MRQRAAARGGRDERQIAGLQEDRESPIQKPDRLLQMALFGLAPPEEEVAARHATVIAELRGIGFLLDRR